jgi:hypothetical protein
MKKGYDADTIVFFSFSFPSSFFLRVLRGALQSHESAVIDAIDRFASLA